MKLGAFEALSFDCYGTLIDWEQGILAELRPWAAAKGLSDDAILEAFGATEAGCEAATPDKPYPGVLADVYRALGQSWGLPVDQWRRSRSAARSAVGRPSPTAPKRSVISSSISSSSSCRMSTALRSGAAMPSWGSISISC